MSEILSYSAEAVVAAMLKAGEAEAASQAAQVTAESLFIDSAIYSARAVTAGTLVRDITKAAKALVVRNPRLKGVVYTSEAMVGAHVRAGRVFLIDDDALVLPKDVTAQKIQSLIRDVSTATADAIIANATTVAEAHAALVKASRAAKSAKSKAAKVARETAEREAAGLDPVSDDATEAAETLADVLGRALGMILEATEAGLAIDAEAQTLAAEIQSILSPIVDAETVDA